VITDETVLELASISGIFSETLLDKYDCKYDAYVLSPKDFIKFARVIYEEGYNDGCKSNVPNPEANRTAINRITMELD
jgi:hypothetical protein